MARTAVVGTIAINAVANTSNLTQGLNRCRSSLTGLMGPGNAANAMLRSLMFTMLGTGTAAGAMAIGIYKSVQNVKSFSEEMAKASAIWQGTSKATMKQLEDTAMAVANSTKFTAVEAAGAYYEIGSAGFQAAEAVQVLPVVAKFAQAAMMGLSDATDVLSTAQQAAGLRTGDLKTDLAQLTRIANGMVKINSMAIGTTENFSKAFVTKAGASARQLNISLETTLALLAVFHQQGIKGEDAGTQLSMTLRDLSAKANENADAWKRAGIEFWDAQGNMVDMEKLLTSLSNKLRGMTPQAGRVLLDSLGVQIRSMHAIQALLGKEGQFKEFRAGLNDFTFLDKVSKSIVPPFTEGLHKMHTAWEQLNKKMLQVAENKIGDFLIRVDKALRGTGDSTLALKVKFGVYSITAAATAMSIIGVAMALGKLFMALRSAATGMAILQALSGPTGWAVLGASIIAGAGAVYLLEKAFEGAGAAASEAEKEFIASLKAADEKPKDNTGLTGVADMEKQDAARKYLEDMKKMSADVTKSLRTPWEIAQDEVRKLNTLLLLGPLNGITKETWIRGFQKVKDELIEAEEKANKIDKAGKDFKVGSAQAGTQEGFAAVYGMREELKRQLALDQKKIDLAKKANDFLQTIAAERTKPQVTPPDIQPAQF